MKNILKLCLVFAGAALVATPFVSAQSEKPAAREGAPGGGQGRGANAKMMAEQLGLSAEQTTQVEAILKKQQQAMQAIPQEERREKGKAIREEGKKSIMAVLNDEQKKKWEEIRANAPKGGERPPGEGNAGKKETK